MPVTMSPRALPGAGGADRPQSERLQAEAARPSRSG